MAALVVVAARRSCPTGRVPDSPCSPVLLDSTANVFFLFASREGLLTLVGVIGAMYPASTVVLARIVLGERLARHQSAGLALAAAAVTMIAVA